MREILFRGKRMNNGEWVYGSYAYQYGCHEILLKECDGEYGSDNYHVKPETVGQFTGLIDKHGKKIFEGDIVKQIYSLNTQERPIISTIEYGISWAYSNVCGVCQRFRDGSGVSLLSVGDESGVVYCEVIGNIHDNPELLLWEANRWTD